MEDKTEKKSLKDRMKGSLDTIKTTAKNVKVSEIKIPEIKKPEVKLSQVKELFKKKDPEDHDEEVRNDGILQITSIATRDALKIVYYLMAVDGEFTAEEKEKYEILGKEISPDFDEQKEKVIAECQNQLEKVIDPEDYYDVLQDGVEDALIASMNTEGTYITPKILAWDLLTLAYSDNDYDEAERRLLKYIVRKTNVDKAVFLEMESTMKTLIDLEKEQQWIKTTDRPYLTIEAIVNGIEDRKQVIFRSVEDMLAL